MSKGEGALSQQKMLHLTIGSNYIVLLDELWGNLIGRIRFLDVM